jgi:hypothetical protein
MENTTRAAHIRWLKVDMEALRLLGIEIDVFTNKEMKAIQVENMMGNTMLQSGMMATQYSMKIGGLGAAFMMFSKSERNMRIGMMLTTTAMAIQMFQVYKSAAAMAAKRREEMLAAGTAEIHTWAMVRQAAATKIVSAATLKAAASFFLLDKAIVAVASRVVVLLVAFFLIEKLMNKIGLFEMPDMTMAEDMGGQIADTGLIIEYMAMETTALNTILEDNATMVAAIGDKTDSTTARIVQAKEAENLAIYEVLQARRLEILSLEDAEKAVNDYIVAQDLLNQIKKEGKYEAEGEGPEGYGFLGLGDEMLWIYNNISKPLGFPKNSIINWMTGGLIEDQEEATKIVEDFAIDFVDLHDWMGDTVFDNWEDAAFALQEYVDAFAGVTADELSGGIVGSLTTTTDALYKFNNAREEMFFGFSSDRLTGDLVRQVHQQGVETLITSTEVIMHNNFNGMTTEEVAEEIIGFIETGGNFANYNIGSYGG